MGKLKPSLCTLMMLNVEHFVVYMMFYVRSHAILE